VVDCGVCGNKTNIAVAVGDSLKLRECECRKKRDNIIRLERSGLLDLMAEYTFDNFQVNEEFQRRIKTPALEFINQTEKQNSPRKWFYIGGRVGCGKTHICTAIVGALIEKGMSAKYMMYRDEAVMLKGMVGTEEYSRRVEFLKNVEVLYIDDLFKTQNVTDGDKNLMFEVINARYNSRSKITVISSEKIIDEVIEADEGIGSRIYERSRDFITNVGADKAKNWRLEGIFK